MKCKYCNTDIEQDARFCPNCGKDLSKYNRCIKCGELLDKGTSFCPYCGVEQPKYDESKGIKKWPFVILVLLIIGVGAWFLLSGSFSFGEKTDKSRIEGEFVDSTAVETDSSINTQQDIKDMKAFLEDFYGKMDAMGQIDEMLIKKSLTPKALRILKEKGNDYLTNDEGVGGQLSSYKVTHVKENLFEVCVVLYGMGTYFDHKVILGVVKEGDNFKIDTITKPQEDVASTTANEAEANNSYFMSGHVSDYPITMYIEINGTQVKGHYYYDRQYEKKGMEAKLNLSGTNENGQLDLMPEGQENDITMADV